MNRERSAEHATRTCERFVNSIVKIIRFYDYQTWQTNIWRNWRGAQRFVGFISWLCFRNADWLSRRTPITWIGSLSFSNSLIVHEAKTMENHKRDGFGNVIEYLHNFLLRFLLRHVFVWEVVSNTRTSVWPCFNTSRTFVKKLSCASFFNFRSRCLETWWNTRESVWYITSNHWDFRTQALDTYLTIETHCH